MEGKTPETSKVFQDSVHGAMKFDEFLVKIIDTPEFQRMRTCFLAGQMLDAIERNTHPDISKIFMAHPKWQQYKRCVQVAALCHDLGHGPFSHTWDQGFVPKAKPGEWTHEVNSKKITKLILISMGNADPEFRNEVGGDLDKGTELQEIMEKMDGEAKINLLKEIGEDGITIIEELIDGEGKTIPCDLKFLMEIVANKENGIDVDKWDYFLRDGQGLNIKITFDYERLLRFCEVVQCTEKNCYRLSFRDKERMSILGMFRMRADLHIKAYQHEVVKKLDAMLVDAFMEADKKYWNDENRLSEAHGNTPRYLRLTDHIFTEMLYKEDASLLETQKILRRIANRDLYEVVDKWTPKTAEEKTAAKTYLKDLQTTLGEKYYVSKIYVDTGAKSSAKNPLENVHFHTKSRVCDCQTDDNDIPKLNWDLPFVKVLVLCKDKDIADHEEAKKNFKDWKDTTKKKSEEKKEGNPEEEKEGKPKKKVRKTCAV